MEGKTTICPISNSPQQGTELTGTGKCNHLHKRGLFQATTLQPVFNAETKFDSNTDWRVFYARITPIAVMFMKIIMAGTNDRGWRKMKAVPILVMFMMRVSCPPVSGIVWIQMP